MLLLGKYQRFALGSYMQNEIWGIKRGGGDEKQCQEHDWLMALML